MKNSEIIIIGAGIAGLVAGYNLQKKGFKVTILEKDLDVGGRMITKDIKNFIVDGGTQFLSSGYPIISNLINELELSYRFVETSPYVGIVKNKKICKFRYDNPFSLLRVLSFKDWFSMGVGGYKLKSLIENLLLNDYSSWVEFDNQNAKEWSDEFYTKNVTEYFIEPMLEAFYFQTPEQTSKALPIALTKFTLQKSKTMTLKGGINILAKELSKNLNIKFNERVIDIKTDGNMVKIQTENEYFIANKVVITTPAPITKSFYSPNNKYEKKLLDTKYSSTINISIILKEKLTQKNIQDIYGIWIPRKERDIICAITIERFKCSDRAVRGELLNVMLSGIAGKELIEVPDKKIISKVIKELNHYFPNISTKIDLVELFRWKYAEPLSQIGRAKDINRYRENFDINTPIYLSGDYMGMPFSEGAVESALWSTKKILKS